jgi:DNA (cytosine-5)-methyltransferase 1
VIPVIDIFAGPGGLGEGFSSIIDVDGTRAFKIALSIEKDEFAHKTLTLRSFFRQFSPSQVPEEYYEFIKGNISLESLYKSYPKQASNATNETWKATLGESKDAVSYSIVDKRIREALNGEKNWLLIGGPPCQAYSVVGRVRRQQNILDESKDERVGLYKQYLRILAVHNPAVFVMENVKGLLSATTKSSPMLNRILEDLSEPVTAYLKDYKRNGQDLLCPGYKIYSLVLKPKAFKDDGTPIISQKDFLIRSENYGVPQTRHRVILFGIRNDINQIPDILQGKIPVAISKVLSGLPRLRGKLSTGPDLGERWKESIISILKKGKLTGVANEIKNEIAKQVSLITLPREGSGREYLPDNHVDTEYRRDWFIDQRVKGICNHSARGHMESDLQRYFFISCFAKINGYSPQLVDFPKSLLPDHKNVFNKEGDITRKFADRFRVQLKNMPAKTVTSHISQDGHYFIHYDPTQCRSLTVREAARIQTFPDNYFFCGPRTAQYIQVGNAVPPLLANQIASIVRKVFIAEKYNKRNNTITNKTKSRQLNIELR